MAEAKNNKKRNKNILIGVLIFAAVAGIIIYWYIKNKNETPINLNNNAPTTNNQTPAGFTDVIDNSKILKKGDTGNTVKKFQEIINTKLPATSTPIVTDGAFGSATDAALKIASNNVLSSANNNASINALLGTATGTTPAPSGGTISGAGKLYALIPLTPVYDNLNDFTPARYAGYNEYLGDFSKYQYTYFGNKFAITTTGRAIDADYILLT